MPSYDSPAEHATPGRDQDAPQQAPAQDGPLAYYPTFSLVDEKGKWQRIHDWALQDSVNAAAAKHGTPAMSVRMDDVHSISSTLIDLEAARLSSSQTQGHSSQAAAGRALQAGEVTSGRSAHLAAGQASRGIEATRPQLQEQAWAVPRDSAGASDTRGQLDQQSGLPRAPGQGPGQGVASGSSRFSARGHAAELGVGTEMSSALMKQLLGSHSAASVAEVRAGSDPGGPL